MSIACIMKGGENFISVSCFVSLSSGVGKGMYSVDGHPVRN